MYTVYSVGVFWMKNKMALSETIIVVVMRKDLMCIFRGNGLWGTRKEEGWLTKKALPADRRKSTDAR